MNQLPELSEAGRDHLERAQRARQNGGNNGVVPGSQTQRVEPGTGVVSTTNGHVESPYPGISTLSTLSTLGDLDASDAALLAGIRDGRWLDAQEFPPLRYAVPGLIPEGFALIVGPPKVGKSWLVLHLALCVASGGWALRHIHVGALRPVLYLALEDGDRRMQDRCRSLLGDVPLPDMFHCLYRVEPGRAVDTVRAWLKVFGHLAPLVILDTLGKVMPPAIGGESSYQRDYRVGGQLKATVDSHPGASLLVVHHDKKAETNDFVESVSGTNGLAGSADTILVLNRNRGEEEGLLKVTSRDVPEASYAITRGSTGTWELDGATLDAAAETAHTRSTTQGVGDKSTEVLLALAANPGSGPTEIGRITGMEPKHAGQYLTRHVSAGRAVNPKRGVYYIAPRE